MYKFLFRCLIIALFASIQSVNAQDKEYKSIRIDEVEDDTDAKLKKEGEKEENKKSLEEKNWKWENFRIGGNLGLSFGRQTYVEVSPAFGYWVLPGKFQAGISTKFIYQSIKYDHQQWKSFIYGGGVFADYVIWKGLFARGEFELINKESFFSTERINVPHLLLGGGYTQEISDYGNFYVAALFNVLDSDESIYSGTFGDLPLILRIGFGFGFPSRKK